TAGEDTYDNPHPGVVYGNPGARILIVGERCNPNAVPVDGPFVPFCGTGPTGRWLANQLELMSLDESQLPWVNAQEALTGAKTRLDVAQLPNVHAILALGDAADKWAQEAAYYARVVTGRARRVFTAPHPAYWTRFHAREPWPGLEHAVALALV